ncbi:M90 family metallopeptidase [Neolewinella litorea]|uniref:Peptidase n=1 Tax=Neolewinella litorea TaxID=2562452 RepID=A0A4S4NM63_9BACT|nr:M90 family metallopeptidase [Neolewinella litorea]THH40007.1 peptidase [Neolewinella litorea]
MAVSATVVALIVLALAGGLLYYIFRDEPVGPLPEFRKQWRRLLRNKVTFYKTLDRKDKQRFQERMRYFFQRVRITGIDTEVTELDRVLVAASGIIPTFGFEDWNQYPKLREVLLYPNTFNQETFATEGEGRTIAGMVGGGYLNGKLLLSQQALRTGFENPGRNNTGIHEFAHLLDKADGDTDGIPDYFLDKQYLIPWVEMIRSEMAAIQKGDSDIDDYALTNKAEFFAVAAEYFFNRPAAFAQKHPELFSLMERIFHQDLDHDGGVGTVDQTDPVAVARG